MKSRPRRAQPVVHPRVCGKRMVERLCDAIAAGSSPRVRETHLKGGRHGKLSRFIPACAGNASALSFTIHCTSVHPRVCGKRYRHSPDERVGRGSSPRVRETHMSESVKSAPSRFIPACAGNARAGGGISCARPVHPRVCGKRVTPRIRQSNVVGSSPRVRETPLQHRRIGEDLRFIPACAGNASSTRGRKRFRSVHPRVCGKRSEGAAHAWSQAGSSPRVRETPGSTGNHVPRRRFIPACAGNASPTHRACF